MEKKIQSEIVWVMSIVWSILEIEAYLSCAQLRMFVKVIAVDLYISMKEF